MSQMERNENDGTEPGAAAMFGRGNQSERLSKHDALDILGQGESQESGAQEGLLGRANNAHGGTVQGERSTSIAATVRSLQSRVSSILAAGLMIALGVGALTWYYTTAFSRQAHARQVAESASARRAQGEMPLPPLGAIEQPHVATAALPADPKASVGPAPMLASGDVPLASPPPATPMLAAGPNGAILSEPDEPLRPYAPAGVQYRVPVRNTKQQPSLERRLRAPVFAHESPAPTQPRTSAESVQSPVEQFGVGGASTGGPFPAGAAAQFATSSDSTNPSSMSALLQPTTTAAVRARVLPTQRFLLPKGGFIDCTLETAIDSTLPGMTTCVTATDTFSVDGKVVLLERGTKLVGETRGQVQQGAARVFVLWTEARTPNGVVVPLDSAGTDELGRSGLPGSVNRHFWERFGAAMLISVVDGAVQSAVQSSSHGGGPIIYNPSASESVMTEALKGTVSIAPTVIKHNGDRIQVLVARDLDFRSVYELRIHATAR